MIDRIRSAVTAKDIDIDQVLSIVVDTFSGAVLTFSLISFVKASSFRSLSIKSAVVFMATLLFEHRFITFYHLMPCFGQGVGQDCYELSGFVANCYEL